MLHEIFCADDTNWGSVLAIRTGSSDFSRRLVTGLLNRGMRNHLGKVWRCEHCPLRTGFDRCAKSCPECDGTGLKCIEPISVPTEEEYFKLCGIAFVNPEDRR